MSEHVFVFVQTASHVVIIESNLTRDEVEEQAWDKLPGDLCHQCANRIELAGDWDLLPEEESV